MTTNRLITYLTALPDYAVRQLPERERHALARECRRLLAAAIEEPAGVVLPTARNGEHAVYLPAPND